MNLDERQVYNTNECEQRQGSKHSNDNAICFALVVVEKIEEGELVRFLFRQRRRRTDDGSADSAKFRSINRNGNNGDASIQ